ncbi:aminopeptidase P N-terminal domain-containing protein [Pseudoclavibacter caeni]|nr:aminopeptidase P N-terminal domain-containing protein [Pseudoclavibacter caeni]NYJ96925.1 hypothetical protein [Pseudoclavibacter caeni]
MAEWDDVAGDADVRAARAAAAGPRGRPGRGAARPAASGAARPHARDPRRPTACAQQRLRPPFRPHSAFTHLTGWGWDAVPGAVLVSTATGRAVLRFRPPAGHDTVEGYADPVDGAFWTGPRPGLDAVSAGSA